MNSTTTKPRLASRLVNSILAIKPLANFAKQQARDMMINRAEKMGVPWRSKFQQLSSRDWDGELATVVNTDIYNLPRLLFNFLSCLRKG